eukprot:COSAG02_NODE_1073_length_14776_cov_6.711930_2_plen_85_part_00
MEPAVPRGVRLALDDLGQNSDHRRIHNYQISRMIFGNMQRLEVVNGKSTVFLADLFLNPCDCRCFGVSLISYLRPSLARHKFSS